MEPRPLNPTQRLMLKPLMLGAPVSKQSLVTHLYGSRRDGPEYADVAVRMAISRLRRRLAVHAIDLLTIGQGHSTEGWMIDPDHVPRLAALLSETPAAALERARLSAPKWRKPIWSYRRRPAEQQLALAL